MARQFELHGLKDSHQVAELNIEKALVTESKVVQSMKESLIKKLEKRIDDQRIEFQQYKRFSEIDNTKLTNRIHDLESREIEMMQANSELLKKTIFCEDALETQLKALESVTADLQFKAKEQMDESDSLWTRLLDVLDHKQCQRINKYDAAETLIREMKNKIGFQSCLLHLFASEMRAMISPRNVMYYAASSVQYQIDEMQMQSVSKQKKL